MLTSPYLIAAFAGIALGAPAPQIQGPPTQGPPPVPDFVKAHAPILYLQHSETYMPSLIETHLANVLPKVEGSGTALPDGFVPTMSNLDELNNYGTSGTNVYLTAKQKTAGSKGRSQEWLKGIKPVDGKTAPTVTIIVDRGQGVVDAFWLTFYSYNRGTDVTWWNFGNHVADWEQVMIRFQNGAPFQVWLSQHSDGQAFTFEALEKYKPDDKRIVAYVAKSSHAIYSTKGDHDHTIDQEANNSWGPIEDHTDKGFLWDTIATQPLYYHYNITSKAFTAAAENADLPVNWLNYDGRWGDKKYSEKSTSSQETIFGQSVYVDGPTGPNDKHLDRTKICPPKKECKVYKTTVV